MAIATQDILEQLQDGVAQLASSEEWTAWLRTQARFYNYSFGNCMLIARQYPGATMVAGFHRWKELSRFVRKGEHGIKILAPCKYKVEAQEAGVDDTFQVRGFRVVSVFAYEQTDGEPLAELPCERLTGDTPEGAFEILASYVRELGFSLDTEALPGETNGFCQHATRRIVLREGLEPAQRLKTLFHETAHALMHEGACTGRSVIELEAESTAYCCMSALGISSDDYSFGYLLSWAGGGQEAIDAIKASAGRIQQTVRTILDSLGPAGAEGAS